jgi:hypothetical protein
MAAARDATVKHDFYALKPIKPITFEGPFRELPPEFGAEEGVQLRETVEMWQQHCMQLQQQQQQQQVIYRI